MEHGNVPHDALFVLLGTIMVLAWKIDDVLGGMGGVSFLSQVAGSVLGVAIAFGGGFVVYGALKAFVGIRLDEEQKFIGADLAIHKISAEPERER